MAKKTKGEFEKMGDLGKGVDESEGDAEKNIEEIENFDATKPQGKASEEAGEETGGKKKKKRATEDVDALREELEQEKEKSKGLAAIIEKVSAASGDEEPEEERSSSNNSDNSAEVDSKIRSIEGKINDQVQTQIKDVRTAITAMASKIDEVSKAEKSEKAGSKVKDMVDKLEADTSKRISDLQEEIRKMVERIEQPRKEEEVSKGLAVFGGRVDLKNDILEIKSSIKELEKSIREVKEEADTRITRVREQIKVLERMPMLEEKIEGLTERMSPANIEKLKKFVFSADEITGEIIPNEVEKKLSKDLTPVFNDMRGIRSDIEKLSENIKTLFNETNYFKGEIKTLYKMGDYISELQAEKEKTHSKINEKEANLISMMNKLEAVLQKKADLMNERLEKFDRMFTGKLEDKAKEFFDELTESKFLELEDRTEKNLAVSRAKVNDMFSKFVQFQNVVNPTLSLIKEEIEKTNTRLDKLKVKHDEFEKDIEENAKDMFNDIVGPQIKAISNETAKFTKDVSGRLEDFEAEFVQFQNVVNPTLTLFKNDISKLDTKIEKQKTRQDSFKEDVKEIADVRKEIEGMREWVKYFEAKQKENEKHMLVLGSKLDETVAEFNAIVKETIAEKKKFEDENRKQREKINILLKELKSG